MALRILAIATPDDGPLRASRAKARTMLASLRILLLLTLGCLASLSRAQESPSRDIDVADIDAPPGLAAMDVEWKRIETTRSGAMLAAVAKPRGTGPFPTLVLVHGSHGFAREYVHLAREIASQGFLVVAACWFRGGERGNGAVSVPIECPDAIDMPPGPSDAARDAVNDLVTAVRSMPDVRPDLIAIFGHSRGAGAAANYLVHGGPADAAILESSGYDDSYIAGARHVRARVLVLHGLLDTNDAFTAPERARSFVAALKAAKLKPEAHFYKAGTHNALFTDRAQHDDEVRRIAAFLRQTLK
jgi:dienelactone hydrolase